MLAQLSDPQTWITLVTLAVLEIVLGVDNIVFLAIMTGRLPPPQRLLGYRLGIGGALITRLLLLATLSSMMRLQTPLVSAFGHPFSGRDIVLGVGGLFLIGKSSSEIFSSVEGDEEGESARDRPAAGLVSTVLQVMVIDIVFSLDSVITAVGLGQRLWVMATAVVLAVGVMLVFAASVGDFIDRHPSVKVLALAFLLLIGVMLVADALGQHIDKRYLYFAMGFSLLVEMLNLRMRRRPAAR